MEVECLKSGFCAPKTWKNGQKKSWGRKTGFRTERNEPRIYFIKWNCLLLFSFFDFYFSVVAYANYVDFWKLLMILAVQYWLFINWLRIKRVCKFKSIGNFWFIISSPEGIRKDKSQRILLNGQTSDWLLVHSRTNLFTKIVNDF